MTTVLIVDDDRDLRDVMEAILIDEGYCVRTASNGRDALVALETEMPEAIFLDMMMPILNGSEFLNELGERYSKPPPVVAMSAWVNARPKGATLFLRKPMRAEALVAAAQSICHVEEGSLEGSSGDDEAPKLIH